MIVSNQAAEPSAAFISEPSLPSWRVGCGCPLTSQGCSQQLLTLKSVQHPVTEAETAIEKPRRKLILVPEAGLNKQHHMLGSEQRQRFASR